MDGTRPALWDPVHWRRGLRRAATGFDFRIPFQFGPFAASSLSLLDLTKQLACLLGLLRPARCAADRPRATRLKLAGASGIVLHRGAASFLRGRAAAFLWPWGAR